MLLVLGVGGFAANRAANAAALEELQVACGCARGSVDQTLAQSSGMFYELFGEDATLMRSFMRSEVDTLCDGLEAELGPLTWNVGRDYSPPPRVEARARATAAIDRARPRCPAVYGQALGGGGEELAASLCEELFDGLARNDRAPPESIAVWEWPAAIDRSMCLDGVRARGSRANEP